MSVLLSVIALACQRAIFPAHDGGHDASMDTGVTDTDAQLPRCDGWTGDTDAGVVFACAWGDTVACTTACGTRGRGACTRSCEIPDTSPDSCRSSCSLATCRADEEVCNYCDDNGADGLADEVPLARREGTYTAATCADVALLGGICSPSSGDVALVGTTAVARGARLDASVEVGYGPIVVEGAAEVTWRSPCPAEGWALVVVKEPGLESIGASGDRLGVSDGWVGVAAEWRFYASETFTDCAAPEDEVDVLHLRPLRGDGTRRPASGGLEGVPRLDSDTPSGSGLMQRMRLTILPEVPGVREASVTLERVDPDALVTSCSGAECGVPFWPGDRVRVGITAASNESSWHRSVVTHLEVRTSGGCP